MNTVPDEFWDALVWLLEACGCSIVLIGLAACLWSIRPVLKDIVNQIFGE